MQLFDPPPPAYGDMKYLDHGSVAVLARALIENVATLLYVGDLEISEDEWRCRKHVIDMNDYHNRTAFLHLVGHTKSIPEKPPDFMVERLESNPFFMTLPPKRRKRLLDGDDMFIDGRYKAMLKLGWGEDLTRAVYKYLSNQAHSSPMAFHRTEMNQLYMKGSTAGLVTAAFAVEFARKAIGVACIRMLALFPNAELPFDPDILAALKSEYAV